MSTHYRPEIDGLRAIAVLAVIFYHAGFALFSGGYVGVDVFFVISGYLITSIILRELRQGSFSLAGFYERRARRILPALIVVMAVTFLVGWLTLLPGEMRHYSRSLLAVATFSSNHFFASQLNYWGPDSDVIPLLHTWSLAVEEQFYVIYPLLLILCWKFANRQLFYLIAMVCATSLLLSQWTLGDAPAKAFYLLPYRAWELGLGALLVLLPDSARLQVGNIRTRWPTELSAWGGLALILYAVFSYDSATLFPGLNALLPVMGTCLIIWGADQKSALGRLLASRALVGIGLVSYSAYLWHQPLFAFLRQTTTTELGLAVTWLLIGMTFFLAWLTWHFVEQPFRQPTNFNRQTVFKSALACMLSFIAVGIAGDRLGGFHFRGDYQVLMVSLDEKTRPNFGMHADCDGLASFTGDCRTNDSPEILVWGDSYAMHLVPGILSSQSDARLIQLTKSACGPFLDLAPVLRDYPVDDCLEFNRQVRVWLEENESVRYAVLSSPFTSYHDRNIPIRLRDGSTVDSKSSFVDTEFRKTLEFLYQRGITPVVFSTTPDNQNHNIGRCLVRAEYFGRSLAQCDFSVTDGSVDRKAVFNWLRILGNDFRVVLLDDLICPRGQCATHIDNDYIFRDQGHLAVQGSIALGLKYNFYGMITSSDGSAQPVVAGQ